MVSTEVEQIRIQYPDLNMKCMLLVEAAPSSLQIKDNLLPSKEH